MAEVAARLVRKHLGMPVCLVTDGDITSTAFDQVVQIPQPTAMNQRNYWVNGVKKSAPWYNSSRSQAFDLSPWDRTLLIDADYFVMSDCLKLLQKTNLGFACYTNAHDIRNNKPIDVTCGRRHMAWATVCWFDRSDYAQDIFSMWKHVVNHWAYYNLSNDFGKPGLRNDHALTIALETMNGHGSQYASIPGSLATVVPGTVLYDIKPNGTVLFQTNDKFSLIKSQDLHVVDKQIACDPQWLQLLETEHA
jgi:hypothetical protein